MPKRLPFATQVVGIRFEKSRRKAYNACKAGDEVYLLQDPHNPFHSKAIEVWRENEMLGYLPREVADQVMGIWDDWLTAVGVVILKGPNLKLGINERYSLSIKIERFNPRG